MATAVVPWTDRDTLDEASFQREIGALLEAGYTHLYIFGTAGEGYAVDEVLFEQVARVFVEEMRKHRAEPMVGVISLSLRSVMRRIAFARDELGVHLFQISLPSWARSRIWRSERSSTRSSASSRPANSCTTTCCVRSDW